MKLKCDSCPSGHDELEQVIACQAADQARVRAELDAQDKAEPKRDGRMTARNAGNKLRQAMRGFNNRHED